MKKIIDKIKRYWASILSIIGTLGALSSLLGYIIKLYNWSDNYFLKFIETNYVIIWLVSITLIIFALLYWIFVINRKFINGFSDNFKKRLNLNWDFVGPWKISDDNILIVTGHDEGGITKKGADW